MRLLFVVLLMCYLKYGVNSLNLPGPRVYVVTPSPRTPNDKGRSVPFYYRNWIKRMDTQRNATSIETTTTQKTKTPDLIFAEFESGNNNLKSIRKLLEKERTDTTTTTTTTTSSPIYVPDEEIDESDVNYKSPITTTTETAKKVDMTDYFALYNNLYNTGSLLSPVYDPSSTTVSFLPTSTALPTKSTTMQTPPNNLQNVWHIIDSEKNDDVSGNWEEEYTSFEHDTTKEPKTQNDNVTPNYNISDNNGDLNENFALPGFSTNPGNGGENESRAIRTEQNFRFPYVNLKPFQMKSPQKTYLNSFSNNNKKGQNVFTSLDKFQHLNNPVRGEAQDIVVPMGQDRFNPAQPYLPQQPYGSKSKQSSSNDLSSAPLEPSPVAPVRSVANLVPPPPPQSPKVTADDFPSPSFYESFPPYAPEAPAPRPLTSSSPVSVGQPLMDSGPGSTDMSDPDSPSYDSDRPPIEFDYRYKPPSKPVPQFLPTLPPLSKPFSGYSYDKPPMVDPKPMMDMGMSKPYFHGYHYSKLVPSAPPKAPPTSSYEDHDEPGYGHHEVPPPSYQPDTDYPELIFDKPHGDTKGGNDMKDMGMKPPPQVPDIKPDTDLQTSPDGDSGFPYDFPGHFKYHHDFDDHDYHYHHHETTTTTTEMPRVNRYSYYYLGKKLYYLPLYFSVYFIIYVGALIIKAVLRHKITYPNSWKPNDQTASFFSKRSVESHLSDANLHEITGRVTRAIASAAEKYLQEKSKEQ